MSITGGTLRIHELDNKKYTLIHHVEHGGITVLKDGEVHTNRTGDELVMAMLKEIENLKNRIKQLETLPIEILDDLQRSISVRKVETSEICHHEKMPKPSFNDLNWVIEQIHWLKRPYETCNL